MIAKQAEFRTNGWHTATLLLLAIILLLVLCGCQEQVQDEIERVPAFSDSPTQIMDIEISAFDESPIVGRWEVVDYDLTPVAAVDEEEAENWLGQIVIYSAKATGFEFELCEAPSFEERIERYQEYFGDYEVDPEGLGITEEEVDVIAVQCEGLTWQGPGAETVRVQGDTLVIVYDGIFLLLEPY